MSFMFNFTLVGKLNETRKHVSFPDLHVRFPFILVNREITHFFLNERTCLFSVICRITEVFAEGRENTECNRHYGREKHC